jgi:hypothetical protein
MPTIAIVNGVRLVIYPKDHLPPHLHAIYAELSCMISIVTGDVLEGKLPRKKLDEVRAWLDAHRGQVAYYWTEISNGRNIEGMIE